MNVPECICMQYNTSRQGFLIFKPSTGTCAVNLESGGLKREKWIFDLLIRYFYEKKR